MASSLFSQGEKIYVCVVEDRSVQTLRIDGRNLCRTWLLYRINTISYKSKALSWTHCKTIAAICSCQENKKTHKFPPLCTLCSLVGVFEWDFTAVHSASCLMALHAPSHILAHRHNCCWMSSNTGAQRLESDICCFGAMYDYVRVCHPYTWL